VTTENPIFNANRLKLGAFAFNGESTARTLIPERFKLTWQNSLDVAKQADQLGFEVIVPYARFRSTVSPQHHSAIVYENLTWTAAMAATRNTCVMTTVHVTNVHPVLAAKALTTIDHISSGKFALNIVCGWFKEEAEMFGVQFLDHAGRYKYADEWITVIKRLWTESDEFDFEGVYIQVKGGMSVPKPIQKPHPPLMNAGSSPEGREFVAKHCDIAFVRADSNEMMRAEAASYRKIAREKYGRDLQVWAPCSIILGDSKRDAERLVDHYTAYADQEYLQSYFQYGKWDAGATEEARSAAMRKYATTGNGLPLIGDAASIADQMLQASEAGIDGFLLTWVDFQNGIRRFGAEVMPLLVRAGVRTTA
jgi:alkanesulfonate monooxygenase SsuD/methylene tetrahydromethanopterin reductase-like flavin-dependent oxidoreductase (luciferase family)